MKCLGKLGPSEPHPSLRQPMVVGVGVGRKVSTRVEGVGMGVCAAPQASPKPHPMWGCGTPPPPKGLVLAWEVKEPLPVGHVGDVAPPPLEGGGAERSFPGVPPMEGMRPGDPGKFSHVSPSGSIPQIQHTEVAFCMLAFKETQFAVHVL